MKLKKCKQCGIKFTPVRAIQPCCSFEHTATYAMALVEKKNKRELAKTKREHKAKLVAMKSLTQLANEAQVLFNQWIRNCRDKSEPCISCGRYHTGQYHAGHYRTRGSAAHLRFDEDNCHKQCAPCNNHLSGNIVNYRAGLIAKIGIERVEAIENNNATHKWTREELIEIKNHYKIRIKQHQAIF